MANSKRMKDMQRKKREIRAFMKQTQRESWALAIRIALHAKDKIKKSFSYPDSS